MRKPLVAGNWKLNKTVAEAKALITAMLGELDAIKGVEKVVCPPFLAVPAVSELAKGSTVGVGTQNLFWEESGAFTGEVAPNMVAELCQYVIIGHSERRQYFGETDETVNKRLFAALKAGLKPIVCVGETLAENEANKTAEVVTRQINEGLKGLTVAQAESVIIAYEPVWAIGTGKTATPEQANHVHGKIIRPLIQALLGAEAADAMRILYGGSVKPDNAAELFAMSDIDGGLVGGACLKADSFVAIVKAAA